MRVISAIAVASGLPPLILPPGVEQAVILNDQECDHPEKWDAEFLEYKGLTANPTAPTFVPCEHPDGSGQNRPWPDCSTIAKTITRVAPSADAIFHLIPAHGFSEVLGAGIGDEAWRSLVFADICSGPAMAFYAHAREAGRGRRGALAVEVYPTEALEQPRDLEEYTCRLVAWQHRASKLPVWVTWCPLRQTPFYQAPRAGTPFSQEQVAGMTKGAARAGAAGIATWGWSHTTAEAHALYQDGLNLVASSAAAAAS